MTGFPALDAQALLERVAGSVPEPLRSHVVVIGSIAAAWAFRGLANYQPVATKDIDLLLRPAVDAVATAQALARIFLDQGWQPAYPEGQTAADAATPDDRLPALRLTPPTEPDTWFLELLAEPPTGQMARKQWHRFSTPMGEFGLPSFRFMPVAIHEPEATPFGISVAHPACMALANLLEHAERDETPISSLPGQPPRFAKDVGRAVALWWLADQDSSDAPAQWIQRWQRALGDLYGNPIADHLSEAQHGLRSLRDDLRDAHRIAAMSVLAPYATTLQAFRRAYRELGDLVEDAKTEINGPMD